MTLQDFINIYTGQAVSCDGIAADTGQCEQLVCLYWQKVYGYNCPMIPAAKDLWTNADVLAHFDQISTGNEQAGDVAVWGASPLINSPEFGHTDIVISHGFNGFDSNWGGVTNGTYPVAHQVQHNYTDVLGFLRWKGSIMDPTQLAEQREQWLQQIAQAVSVKGSGANGEVDGNDIPQILNNISELYQLINQKDAEIAQLQAGVTKNQVLSYINNHLG